MHDALFSCEIEALISWHVCVSLATLLVTQIRQHLYAVNATRINNQGVKLCKAEFENSMAPPLLQDHPNMI